MHTIASESSHLSDLFDFQPVQIPSSMAFYVRLIHEVIWWASFVSEHLPSNL